MDDRRKEDRSERAEGAIKDYALEILPEELVGALRLLADLDFPVTDAPDLRTRVEAGGADGGLLELLRPVDFPLSSARNAFDKLSVRAARWAEIPIKDDIDEPRIPDPGEFDEQVALGRSMEDVFRSMFWPHCAKVAYETYLEQRAGGATHRGAHRGGEAAGKNCEQLTKSVLEKLDLGSRGPSIPPRFRFPPL